MVYVQLIFEIYTTPKKIHTYLTVYVVLYFLKIHNTKFNVQKIFNKSVFAIFNLYCLNMFRPFKE